jgi:hypothetical protein
MKKLLFLLSFIVTCYIGQSQALVTLKGGQFGVSSLLPIQPFTLVGNPTGSIAVPQAFGIGYGLIFQGGKLAVDTTIKDTVFAYNGLQWIGPGTRTIGLGGFMAQNTTISGSNAWFLNLDSFPAAAGRGFRVNFGSDAGWDLMVRDSATGFWTRIPKGTVGQALTMLGGGGIGWGAGGGGSSGFTVSTAANTANYTVPTGRKVYVILSDLTGQANRNAVLPAATTGDEFVFVNKNAPASTFAWTFTVGTVKDYGQNTITTLTNLTIYHLVYDGTNFQIIN